MTWPGGRAPSVREALRLIAADPALGRQAFGDPSVMRGVLSDYLPDAPAEASIIKAAITAGVPAMLTSDLPPATSIPLAVAQMSERTGYPVTTCHWVVREIAVAFGMAAPEPTDLIGPATISPVPPATISDIPSPRRNRRTGLIAVMTAVIVLLAGWLVFLAVMPHGHPAHHPRAAAPATSASTSQAAAAAVRCGISARCPYGHQGEACTAGGGVPGVIEPPGRDCDTNVDHCAADRACKYGGEPGQLCTAGKRPGYLIAAGESWVCRPGRQH